MQLSLYGERTAALYATWFRRAGKALAWYVLAFFIDRWLMRRGLLTPQHMLLNRSSGSASHLVRTDPMATACIEVF
jgi:hypothetical protein